MSSDITDGSDLNQRRVYNKQERAAINLFKEKYMEATTSGARKTIAQLDIFPSLFNYWKSIGKVYDAKKTRMKSNVCLILIFQIDIYIYTGSTPMAPEYMAS